MSKRNKLRYKSRGNQFPTLTLTGKVSLRDLEQEEVQEPAEITAEKDPNAKGDLKIFLSTDSLVYNSHVGNYEATGLEGYLKASVFDGKGWKPLSLEEFFPKREHYFGKRERPIDTYNFCLNILEAAKGTILARTYREHYRVNTPGDDEN